MAGNSPFQWKWVQAAGMAAGAMAGPAHASSATGVPPNPKAAQATAPTLLLQQYERMIDLKIEAAEARIELKLGARIDALSDKVKDVLLAFAQMDAKYDGLKTAIAGKAGPWTVWGAAGTVLVGVIAVLGLAVAVYGNALSASGAFADKVLDAKQNAREQSTAMSGIDAKLNDILRAQKNAPKPAESPRAKSPK